MLLVDDNELTLGLLRMIIESAGHRCATARSGADALVYCDVRRPSAVVTDLSMPGLDGGTLARWFKARYPSVPLFLVTGHDLHDPAVTRLRSTFDEILTKPYDPDRLLDALARYLPPPRRRPRDGQGIPKPP